VLAFLLLLVVVAGPALAQVAPTPEMVEECTQVGIEMEKCTEQAILTMRSSHFPPKPETGLDPAVLSILVGCGAAFAAGVVYVKRASHGKSNQKPQ
jgi:hypothetical protein